MHAIAPSELGRHFARGYRPRLQRASTLSRPRVSLRHEIAPKENPKQNVKRKVKRKKRKKRPEISPKMFKPCSAAQTFFRTVCNRAGPI